MEKLILFTGLFLVISQAYVKGQDKNNQEEIIFIQLKKGLTLQGQLIELAPGDYAKILTDKGHIVHVPDHKIRRYYFSENSSGIHKDGLIKADNFKDVGFYQHTTLGLILNTVSARNGGVVGFQFTASAGYLKSRLLGLGAGVGADFYRTGASEMIFPIFGEVRGYFMAQPSTPYYVIRTGYGIALANPEVGIQKARGGWMFNPAFGWRLGDGKGLKLTVDIGVQFQSAEYLYTIGREIGDVDVLYKRLNLRLGLLL